MEQFYHYLVFDSNGKGIMHWNTSDETIDEFVQYCVAQVENGNWDLDYKVSVNGPENRIYTLEELFDECYEPLDEFVDSYATEAGGTDFNKVD